MIWFACKQCSKRHGRAEHLAGTLVFCECGQGNRVPWSSTVPEPEPEEAPPAPPPRPRPPRPPVEDRVPEPEFRRPRRDRRRPNPAYCLNHDEKTKEATCDACRGSFCSACVVTLQGQTLCGPCKNFRVRGLHRPGRVAPLALVSLVLSLVSGPVATFLALVAIGMMAIEAGTVMSVMVCLFGALLPIASLVLGWSALKQIEGQPNMVGRSLAVTGVTTGLAGAMLCASIAFMTILKQVQG